MFLVSKNYFVYLTIPINIYHKASGLCQIPDDENFAKVFTELLQLNILAIKLCVLMFDRVLNLSLYLPVC